MPFEVSCEAGNGICVRFSGNFDFKVNNEANIEVYSSPLFEHLRYAIWDLRGITDQNMTMEESTITSEQDQIIYDRKKHFKLAVLVGDSRTRLLADHYVSGCQRRNMRWDFLVSDSMDEISAWTSS
jgi:hypothetical protein